MLGRNTITPPTPPTIPSTTMSFSTPSGMTRWSAVLSHATALSIQSIGYCPTTNVAQNIRNIMAKKIGKPMNLFVARTSRICVRRFPLRVPGVYVSASAPATKPYFSAATIDEISSPFMLSIRPLSLSRRRMIGLLDPSRTWSFQ